MSFPYARTLALLGVVSSAALLGACSNSVPGCSDSETKDLVIEIADRELAKQVGAERAKSVSWELTAIRTTDKNEKTGAFECAADMEVSGPGGKNSSPITYTVEATDDGDFYVNVFGL